MNADRVIVLTGGPGGGKTTFIQELSSHPAWAGRFSALPEAISLMAGTRLSMQEKPFQCEMVRAQVAREDQWLQNPPLHDDSILLCNRGSLDPLAYWLERGWGADEFFKLTRTTLEGHYRRYAAVIHLVTTALGAEPAYQRWPQAPRRESLEEARHLDLSLQSIWQGHPHYSRVDNLGRDWQSRSDQVRSILEKWLAPGTGQPG